MIKILDDLVEIIDDRKINYSDNSYVANLFSEGKEKILKKIGEEASEVVIAGMKENKKEIIHECADLLFHNIILLRKFGIHPDQIFEELESRLGKSGILEKKNRNK